MRRANFALLFVGFLLLMAGAVLVLGDTPWPARLGGVVVWLAGAGALVQWTRQSQLMALERFESGRRPPTDAPGESDGSGGSDGGSPDARER